MLLRLGRAGQGDGEPAAEGGNELPVFVLAPDECELSRHLRYPVAIVTLHSKGHNLGLQCRMNSDTWLLPEKQCECGE